VWKDVKSVNVIATALFSKVTKICVAALKFFAGRDVEEESDDSDEEEIVSSDCCNSDASMYSRGCSYNCYKKVIGSAPSLLCGYMGKTYASSRWFEYRDLHVPSDWSCSIECAF